MAQTNASGGLLSEISTRTYSNDFSQAQSSTDIITPSSGKYLKIKQVYASTADSATNITLEFSTSEIVVFKLYTDKKQAQAGNISAVKGAIDEPLTLTCGANTFVSISYDELSV